jgi:hypothetical protein
MQGRESHGITLENASEKLVEYLPELKEAYDKERQGWDNQKPGAHVVYGDILNAYIIDRSKVGDAGALSRAFHVVEMLATNADVLVQEIAGASIVEYLRGQKRVLKAVRPFMGPATLELLRKQEEWAARFGLGRSVMGDLRSLWRGIRRLFGK